MDQAEIIAFLRKTDIFHQEQAEALQAFAEVCHVQHLKSGEFLMHENEPTEKLFLIHNGSFAVRTSPDSTGGSIQANSGTLHPHDCVGEFGLLDDLSRSPNVVANSDDCCVVYLYYADIKKLVVPTLYARLATRLIHYLHVSDTEKIEQLQKELKQSKLLVSMGHFITYMLLLTSAYSLTLSFFTSLVNDPYTNLFASTSVILIWSIAISVMAYQMGFTLREYGVTLVGWVRSLPDVLGYTFTALLIITFTKWLLIHTTARFHDAQFIDMQAIIPIAAVGSTKYVLLYSSAFIVYGAFALLQEFVARGAIQSSLMVFLNGKYKNWLANIVTSGMFAAMHMHISATLAMATFLPSLLWGWLYTRHRTLMAPILSHVLIGWYSIFILGVDLMLK